MQKYGWHGLSALECAVKDEINRQNWQTHTATVLWCIGKIIAGDKWNIPSYIELAYPNSVKTDKRTGAEIIKDLKARLS